MKRFQKAAAAAIASLATLPAFAVSTLPAGIDTGITGAKDAGIEVIGLLSAAGAAVWLLSKVLKKFGVMM